MRQTGVLATLSGTGIGQVHRKGHWIFLPRLKWLYVVSWSSKWICWV